jgi:hypothetical protein
LELKKGEKLIITGWNVKIEEKNGKDPFSKFTVLQLVYNPIVNVRIGLQFLGLSTKYVTMNCTPPVPTLFMSHTQHK